MATNRYGQIYHGDYHHINIRFPSTEARLKFQKECGSDVPPITGKGVPQ